MCVCVCVYYTCVCVCARVCTIRVCVCVCVCTCESWQSTVPVANGNHVICVPDKQTPYKKTHRSTSKQDSYRISSQGPTQSQQHGHYMQFIEPSLGGIIQNYKPTHVQNTGKHAARVSGPLKLHTTLTEYYYSVRGRATIAAAVIENTHQSFSVSSRGI